MSLCYSPSFNRSEVVELGKNYYLDLMDDGSEHYHRYLRPSSPEMETMLARFISACNESENLGERSFMKQEPQDSYSIEGSQMVYPVEAEAEAQQICISHRHDSVESNVAGSNLDSSFDGIFSSMGSHGNRSNLVRHSSSPAGFFSDLDVENGFTVMKGACGLDNQLNFSSGSASFSRHMPQIAENGNENMGMGNPDRRNLANANGNGRGNNGHYIPNFQSDSWDESAFNGLKRSRDHNDVEMFSTSTGLEIQQNEDFGHSSRGLTHHLSLPRSFEMAPREKVLHFQGSVPCKMRAKRGFATHPRSIAERNRRTRISERIRKLQDLCPNMDKQTNTADMLELVVDYIKELQKDVKTLRDTKDKCSCSSKHKQSSSIPSA